MKLLSCISLFAAIVLVGCGKSDSPKPVAASNAPATSGNPLSAPADYAAGLAASQSRAIKTIDTAALNQEIQLFQVQIGRYPTNLNELVQKQFIGHVPDAPNGMKILYDPTNGVVNIVNAQ